MSIVLQSSGGGSVTIAEPATASNFTATLPAATGDVMVSGNMPAFSAYLANTQSVTANTYTKCLYDTEEFDTNNNFASSRFTPTVAGYYQINASIYMNGSALAQYNRTAIYKNGAIYKANLLGSGAPTFDCDVPVNAIVYCNGTTDYIEIYGQNGCATGTSFGSSSTLTFFQAAMIRSA